MAHTETAERKLTEITNLHAEFSNLAIICAFVSDIIYIQKVKYMKTNSSVLIWFISPHSIKCNYNI